MRRRWFRAAVRMAPPGLLELLDRLQRLAPSARVAIIDLDQPTHEFEAPPALRRRERVAVGYPEVERVSPAGRRRPRDPPPPDDLPPVESIRLRQQ